MLEDEGAAFVGVAPDALVLLEAAEQPTRRGRMRIVTGRAFEHALAQAMALVVLDLRELLAMAREADSRRGAELLDLARGGGDAQQSRRRVLAVLRVATRAGQSRLRVRATIERRVRIKMAGQAARISLRHGFLAEREYRPAPGLPHVLRDVAVTVSAGQCLAGERLPVGIVEHGVWIARERLELIAMTNIALAGDAHVGRIRSGFLRRDARARQQGQRQEREEFWRPHCCAVGQF